MCNVCQKSGLALSLLKVFDLPLEWAMYCPALVVCISAGQSLLCSQAFVSLIAALPGIFHHL